MKLVENDVPQNQVPSIYQINIKSGSSFREETNEKSSPHKQDKDFKVNNLAHIIESEEKIVVSPSNKFLNQTGIQHQNYKQFKTCRGKLYRTAKLRSSTDQNSPILINSPKY